MGTSLDGFGNRLSQNVTSGSGPSNSLAIDGNTNRVIGATYDAAGYQLSGPNGGTLSYDGYGRMTFAYVGGHSVTEEYSPRQERVLVKDQSSSGTVQTVYFWGARGERIGTYTLTEPQYQTNTITLQKSDVYFAGRRIDQRYDRLGSAAGVSIGPAFHPYGELVGGGSLDGDAFATYDRNATIGLDYARNRQYASGWGRFTSADPYQASAEVSDPQTWNRYVYTAGDPVNRIDPSGLDYYFSSEPYADPSSGTFFTWGFSLSASPYSSNPAVFIGLTPLDFGFYADNQDYSFSHRFDGSSRAPASFSQRVKDARWFITAKQQLQSFAPQKGSDCEKDLKALDLSASKIRSLAGEDTNKGGTNVVDIRRIVNPTVRAQFNRNADATADVESHAIIINLANFWQTSYSEILGTVLHELVHFGHWGYTDTDIQHRLGLKEDANDTSNISLKLSKDCFSGQKDPF